MQQQSKQLIAVIFIFMVAIQVMIMRIGSYQISMWWEVAILGIELILTLVSAEVAFGTYLRTK